jgi:hypothetical protein
VPSWKLTVRHGSDVDHESFGGLDEAVEAMRERAMAIRSEGPVREVSALRDFRPADQVHARLQLTGPGLLHRHTAGVDVRGDGAFVAYRGAVRREELGSGREATPFDAVRETLAS